MPVIIAIVAAPLIAIGVPAGIATGIASAAITFGAVSAIKSALSPHSPAVGGGTEAWKADAKAGLPYAIGETGTGGSLVFEISSQDNDNTFKHFFSVYTCAGPIDSFGDFKANDEVVAFSSYKATAGTYANAMWLVTDPGNTPATALACPSGTGPVPEWTADHKLSGLASSRWITKFDSKVYAQFPQPIMKGRWVKCYDPRFDSTYPGGSGSQRLADRTTWAWTDNPGIHALQWVFGQTSNGKRVCGIGAPTVGIDIDAFIECANVDDANSWTVGGVVTTQDPKYEVLAAILQAGGAVPARLGAKISCFVEQPRSSIATLTGADFTGDVSIAATKGRRDRRNTVAAQWRSEADGWKIVPADPAANSTYLSEDGSVGRTLAVTFPLVQSVDQAAQLGGSLLANSREFEPVTGPVRMRWFNLKPGDCVTINEAEFGLSSQDFIITSREVDPVNGQRTLTFRSETSAKHAYYLGLTGTSPATPSITATDAKPPAPTTSEWSAVGTTYTAGGVANPCIALSGASPYAPVNDLVVRYRPHGTTDFLDFGTYHLDVGVAVTVRVDSVGSGEAYDLEIRYRAHGVPSDPLVLDNSGSGYTAGTFAGSGGTTDKTPAAVDWANISATSGGTVTASNALQTFTSINVPIEIVPTWTGSGSFAYVKNGASPASFSSGDSIWVTTGDTLAFQGSYATTGTATGTVTVKNHTDGDATLDTFTYSLTSGADDVTPDSVSWADISGFSEYPSAAVGTSSTQAITGITTSITLQLSYTGSPNTHKYNKNGAGFVNFSSGGTVSMSNGDTLAFQFSRTGSAGVTSGVLTVVNQTDASTTLATVNYDVEIEF